jgi:MFS family permease
MHGLYLLWWVEERHLPPGAVAGILAAGDLALTAIEVPTGWFADRFGSRVSLMVGSAVQVAGMLCCWLASGVPGLLGATVLVALGDGFRSGADQALLYRTCVELDRVSEFQRIEATIHTAELIAMVGLILAGGAIVELWGFGAGWLVEIALSAVGLLLAGAMVEPQTTSVKDSVEAGPGTPEREAPAAKRSSLLALLALTAPAAVLSGMTTAVSFSAQTVGGDPGRMARLVAAITLLEAAGAAVAARMNAVAARGQMLMVAAGVAAAALAAQLGIWPAVGILSLLLGVMHPVRAAAIQRRARDEVRARAASVASACDEVCDTVALALAGLWRRPRR